MTTTEMIQKADELDAKAAMLHMSLLAPSMREETLRIESSRLRYEAAKQEEAAAEYGRLARGC